MRKSLQDIARMVRLVPYHTPLPSELIPLHYYLTDSGHCILCIPKAFCRKATPENYWMYEVPVQARYVLEKGWRRLPGTDCIIVDVPYSEELGALVPGEYDEF